MTQNPVYHAHRKHIDGRFYKIRELVEKGEVALMMVNTKENLADALTKALPKNIFHSCMWLMGLKKPLV